MREPVTGTGEEAAPKGVRPGTPADDWLESWGDSSAPSACRVCLDRPGLPPSEEELPAVGQPFLGFHLLARLGEGTFGRVYLARQGELADRLVALKVSTEIVAESQKLARLQHTHIVPVYSLHRAGPLQAVCMPYLGATTLADVLADLGRRDTLPASGAGLVSTLEDRKSRTRARLDQAPAVRPVSEEKPRAVEVPASLRRLEGLTYVEAVLWLGSCLADGLAHAHERGIVHRDLKPANVLLTDDGQPMLLDFNLADDLPRGEPRTMPVGGTLPYMAPEHLTAFLGRPALVDARCDVYSLGVILYELLTGRPPFPPRPGLPETAVPAMIADRLGRPPRARPFNQALSPAVEALLRRCLHPDPARRYPSARQLREDVDHHLAHLPLKHTREPSLTERFQKWARRHPRLASTTTVVALSAVLLFSLVWALAARSRQLARLEAEARHDSFRADLRATRLLLAGRPEDREEQQEGRDRALAALDRYGVLDRADWRAGPLVRHLPQERRERLEAEVGELLLLTASASSPAEGMRMNEAALACFTAEAPRGLWRQRADLLERLGQLDEARRVRARAESARPAGGWDGYLLARERAMQGRYPEAVAELRRLLEADPENFAAWYLLGSCCLDGFADHQGRVAEAVGHYTACIALRPRFAGAWYNRGLARLRLRRWAEAEADLDRALEWRPSLVRARVLRAAAREGRGDLRGALADLDEALEQGASPTRVLLVRSRVKQALGDRAGARRDRREALERTPADEEGWIARGVARAAEDTRGALEDFARAVRLNPRSLAGWQNRAHVLAERLGRTREAIAALDAVLRLHPEQVPARAARGVLHARLGRRQPAHADARAALKAAGHDLAVVFQAAGVFALTSRQTAGDRAEALRLLARALRGGYGHDLLESDHDLDSLRDDARFRALVRAVRTLRNEVGGGEVVGKTIRRGGGS